MKVNEAKLSEKYLLGYFIEREMQNKVSLLTKRRGRSCPGKDDFVEDYARRYFWDRSSVIARRNSYLWEVYKVNGNEFTYSADLKFFNLVTDLKEDGSSYGSGTNTSKKLVISDDMYEKATDDGKVYICVVLDLLVGGENELYIEIYDLHRVLNSPDLFTKAESGLYFNIKNYLKFRGRV